jgi:dipeptidyl aminopeptidase/acylaminoacyl peptidase
MKKAMVVVLLVLSCGLWAQAPAKHAVTPEELVTMTRLSGMDLSPDGTRVLYGASQIDYPKSEKPVGHIYLVPASGGAARQMTASEAGESSPLWSPDGTRFAFLSRRNGSPQVFVMPVDGGEGVQLGKLKIAPERIKWSPDGKALAFMAEPEPSAAEKAEDEATGDAEIMEAPKDMTQLFTLSYPEGKLEQVTRGDFDVVDYSWAPDGKRFALLTARTQLLYDVMTQASVRVVDLKGKTLAVLSPKEGALQGPPVFSPDGTQVAWRYPTEGMSDMNGVAVCGADGKGFTNAASKLDVHFAQIEWLPDGKGFLALTYEGTRGLLRKLSLQTGEAPVVYQPAGVIGAFRLDRAADRLCMSYSDPASPSSPWSLRADGSDAVQLADLNPQVKEWILPKVERFTLETAPGVSVESLLWTPPRATGAPVAPLMVMPHGGPDWMDQESFDSWGAYLAGKGYSVLNVNFRGSLGYGLAFYAANRGKEGFVDYDDIMAVLDHLVKAGKANPHKLVIGGWSYGGCMTEWAITRTDRFKAAVVGAGVANYYSNYAQSDINHGFAAEWEFLGNPYDNPENFTKGSTVYHIRSVKTPVLILHGKADDRVPYVQGLELYRALKTTGKQVEMVSYPGEGHGFRKPVHNVDRLKRWTAFYDKALGITREEPQKAVAPADQKPAAEASTETK